MFLLSDLHKLAPRAEQVATVPAGVDVDALSAALNTAAWSSEESDFAVFAATLPEPVVLSLRTAIDRVRSAGEVLVGCDGVALSLVSERHYPLTPEIGEAIDEAFTTGVELLIENCFGTREEIELRVRAYSGETDFSERWSGIAASGREVQFLSTEAFVAHVVASERVGREQFRAFTAWIPDEPGSDSATGGIVLEYLSELLAPAENFRVFVPYGEPGNESFLTERNRMMLWQALAEIDVDLDGTIVDDGFKELSAVYEEMPAMTREQPREWWRQLEESAHALAEAARTADYGRLVPRTPGEEALIALATSQYWWESARDMIDEFGYADAYEALPVHHNDGNRQEILAQLTGDADVEMLWDERFAGIEDPSDERNIFLGMGDYRPSAWHTTFEGRAHLTADTVA